MKLKTLVVAAGLIAVPALAFAQSAPAPANSSGPGVSPTVQSPTDMGAGGVSGNTKGIPSRGVKKHATMVKKSKRGHAMTGSAVRDESRRATQSPASLGTGVEKVK